MLQQFGLIFEWDQAKSDKNFAERGFDFEYACRIFGGDIIEWEDTHRDYGERRVIAIGEIDEEIYVIVYTPREHVRRIISARPASRREQMPTTRRSPGEIPNERGRVDVKRVRSATDKDIARWIAEDPDTAPELPQGAKLRLIHNPPLPDVKSIRRKLGLTQAEFARHFGLSRRTIEQWEQGRAVPDRPARILLAVIDRRPRVVEQVVIENRKR